MRLAAGLRPDPLGSYSAPPDPLASRYKGEGREGMGKKGLGIGRERKGREGKDVNG